MKDFSKKKKLNIEYPLYNLPLISDLKDMVYRQAEKCPNHIAFRYSKGKDIIEKTFVDVLKDINKVGGFLYSRGLQKRHIAIVAENSYEWIVVFLAVVNGGMVAVPIAKDLPESEIVKQIKQGDCSAVIYSKSYAGFLKESSMSSIDAFPITDITAIVDGKTEMNRVDIEVYTGYSVSSNLLAAIFFTSGTTGSSKGVCLSHENMAANINAACRNFELIGDTLSVLPFNHAFGLITAIFKVYNFGKATYLNKSLKRVTKDLETQHPQTMFMVPLFVETFYKQIWKTAEKEGKARKLRLALKLCSVADFFGIDIRKKLLKDVLAVFGGNLEYIICGGARLDPFYVQEYRKFGIEILNGYGITECSPVISVNRNHYRKDGSVGLVIPGCEVRIAEDNEILVSGESISMGYYNDPDSTEQAFQDGWYCTGDLGYIDKNGFLFITGRKKDLIILSNGENVSPEMIEQILLRETEIEEIVVFSEGNHLAAEIYPAEEWIGNQDQIEDVIHKYNKNQPSSKQIAAIYLRDTEFEKNTNKKLLRYKVTEVHEHVRNN